MFEKEDEWTWQLGFDEDEISKRKLENETFYSERTGFKFHDDHFGLRPGCFHTLLGPAGKGKSTLIQSLILKWAKTQTVLLYLTEEDRKAIETKFAMMEPNPYYLSTKLHLVFEQELMKATSPDYAEGFIRLLDAKLRSSAAKVLVLDNITTSAFYERINNTMAMLSGLRHLAEKFQIPVVILCHPKKGTNESRGLMNSDDCRGSASLGLKSDYFYILYRAQQTSMSGAVMVGTFIYVEKSRYHKNQGSVYRLDYDAGLQRYTKDNPVPFDSFKEFMKSRDKL